MSDTPRTDEKARGLPAPVVSADFARQLEREAAAWAKSANHADDRLKAILIENAKLHAHIVNLLPYAYMLSRGESAKWAYADLLPYVIADAEAAVR